MRRSWIVGAVTLVVLTGCGREVTSTATPRTSTTQTTAGPQDVASCPAFEQGDSERQTALDQHHSDLAELSSRPDQTESVAAEVAFASPVALSNLSEAVLKSPVVGLTVGVTPFLGNTTLYGSVSLEPGEELPDALARLTNHLLTEIEVASAEAESSDVQRLVQAASVVKAGELPVVVAQIEATSTTLSELAEQEAIYDVAVGDSAVTPLDKASIDNRALACESTGGEK